MKRIVLVMSALATISALGVFAIAYAQRGAKEPASEDASAASPALTGPAMPDTQASASPPTAEPRLLPPDPHINPLRNPQRPFASNAIRTAAVGAEDQPIRPVTRASESVRSSADDRPFPTRTVVSPTVPGDPFGLRAKPEEVGIRRLAGASAAGTSNSPTLPEKPTSSVSDSGSNAPGQIESGGIGARSARPLRADTPSPRTLPPESDDANAATGPVLRSAALESRGSSPRDTTNLRQSVNNVNTKPAAEARPIGTNGTRSDAPTTRPTPANEPALLSPGASTISPVPRQNADAGRTAPPAEPRTAVSGQTDMGRAGEGTGKPGSKHTEGPQAPQVTVQKIAPPEIQVGRAATFQIKLKNTGPVAAHTVELRDIVPKGTRLVRTAPQATPGVHGELVWQLGTLKPGDDIAVEVQVMPIEEGPVGSVATITFSAEASAQTIATKPQLVLKVSAPTKVLIGDEVTVGITVANAGSGIARRVILDERVPPNLQHATGRDLEYEVGDLKPNESRQVELKLTAVQPGTITNLLVARADASVKSEERWDLEVLAPQLEINLEGPKRRFLDREATYKISVSNPGTAPAKQVELVAQLPPGLKFVRANNSGVYDDATRSVRWLLEELPVRETGTVELATIAVSMGEERLRVRSTADKGISVEKEQPVIIDGIAATMFEVTDTRDPVEVNGETVYEIRVLNQGSKESTNVQISVTLPPDMRLVATEPAQHNGDGNRIVFQPLPRLAAKADTTFRVRVQGLKPGDQRVRVQLLTDEIREPITKEESTQVYSDK